MSIKKKILVVDDSETSLYLIRAIFEDNSNLEINIEKDSRSAIKLTKKILPDLLIIDIMMPDIDGFQILNKIKTDETTNHIPVLMISAKQDSESIDKALEQKACGYIKKPIIVEELKSTVNSILDIENLN